MPEKCKNCGASYIKSPIWKGQELDEPFSFDKIIWKNMFKMDFLTLAFIGIVVFMTWSYSHDIDPYKQIYEEPCEFVKANSEVCFQKELQEETSDILFPVGIITDPIS